MKKFLLVSMVAFLMVSACDSEDDTLNFTESIVSRVELVSGRVWSLGDNGKTGIMTGDMLEDDSHIFVGEGSRALVKMSNGSELFINEKTDIVIGDKQIKIIGGEVFADIPPDFKQPVQFNIKDVTVSAAGSGLNINVKNKTTTVYVARGVSIIETPVERVEVETGNQIVIKKGQKGVVEPLSFFYDWTARMADQNIFENLNIKGKGSLLGVDRTKIGAEPVNLQVESQNVDVIIRDSIAHTKVEQTFFNPENKDLEGWFWFTVPDGAFVDGFDLYVNDKLVKGRVIERNIAAATYEDHVRRLSDPALLEWIDGKTYRARIFPVPAAGTRKIVISYSEILKQSKDVLRYSYPMKSSDPIGEFSLQVNLGEEGEKYKIATRQDATVKSDNSLITMRRSGFLPRSDFLLELSQIKESPMEVVRYTRTEDTADYIMARFTPPVNFERTSNSRTDVVIILDTSAGNDSAEKELTLETAGAILKSLGRKDTFSVIGADISVRKIFPLKDMAAANSKNIDSALEAMADIDFGGATDIGSIFSEAFGILHKKSDPAVIYIGDGRATVGDMSNDEITKRVRRTIVDSNVRLFTVGIGENAKLTLLNRIAKVGGGEMIGVDKSDRIAMSALKLSDFIKRGVITNLKIDLGAGLDQVFSNYENILTEGETAYLFARSHNRIPDKITVTGTCNGKDFKKDYPLELKKGDEYGYVPSLWAKFYFDNLMEQGETLNRGNIISLGMNYQLMTPYTSFLVLESYEAEKALNTMNKGKSFNWDTLKNIRSKNNSGDEENNKNRFVTYSQKEKKEESALHMVRSEAVQTAKSSGVLSYLSSGNDPEKAYGQIQNSPLKGLSFGGNNSYNHYGIKGAGRGGGGTGEGTVSLGNLNTIGHGGGGSGSGYGRGAGGLGGRRGSAFKIRSGAAMVDGKISKEVVRRIVHRHINEVKFCYESVVSGKELPDGRIAVKFIISASGSVQMAAIASSTMGNAKIETCVAQAVKRWTFPSIKSGGVAVITYPFLFIGGKSNVGSRNAKPYKTSKKVSKKLSASEQCPVEKKLVAKPAIIFTKSFCSDTSSRPLYEKIYIWKNRFARAGDISSKIDLFFKAGSNCELKRWKDQRAFLDLIENASADENDVNNLMSRFSDYPVLKRYLRRRVLQKTINPAVAGRLMMDESDEWDNLARDLAVVEKADKRIKLIRKILTNYPGNPVALNLLAVELYKHGEYEESELIALNLRKSEAASPDTIKSLCEIKAGAGSQKNAKRVCSEIVEFNPLNKELRLSLGNLFMRFGWFEDAYNQFKIIVTGDDYNPLAILRMAQAASGMGKDDEALRLAYKVAGENETGNEKYQLWAQLFIGSRLALMINSKKTPEKEKEQLLRKLKRTNLFRSSNSVEFLIWEDSDVELNFEFAEEDNQKKSFSTQMIDAKEVGLFMATVKTGNKGESGLVVKNVGNPVNRTVDFTLLKVSYDGKKFQIKTEDKTFEPQPEV